jgi:ssDNA-binding Zn-finger/Zn-ribbon topoisomerase 1
MPDSRSAGRSAMSSRPGKPATPQLFAGDPCPECGDVGGELVERQQRGTAEGFLSCSNWPECEFTADVEPWTRRDEGAPASKGVRR